MKTKCDRCKKTREVKKVCIDLCNPCLIDIEESLKLHYKTITN